MIVPDGITPIEGWKGFHVREGYLYSPSTGQRWRPGSPFLAECAYSGGAHMLYEWQLAPLGDPFEIYAEDLRNVPHIPGPPPEGYRWVYKKVGPSADEDQVPCEVCSCGVHIAIDEEVASPYGHIWAKVYGWGKIIPGTYGWRVQYAYPKEIYVHDKGMVKDLKDYGVPLIPVDQPLRYSRAERRALRAQEFAIVICLASGFLNAILGLVAHSLLNTLMAGVLFLLSIFMGFRRRKYGKFW